MASSDKAGVDGEAPTTSTSVNFSDGGSAPDALGDIPTLTVSQTVSALTLSSSNTQSLTITATCAYPAVSLDVYFVPTRGGTAVSSPSSTATCTSTGNTGCADTDANGYNCVIVPKLETSLSAGTYYVQFVVNLAGQYEPIGLTSTITDTVITIGGGPATVHLTPSTTSYTPQEGQTLPTVTCSSDCNPVCTYSWTKDEQSHTTGSDIQLTNIQRGQTGVYRCTASNKYGNQTSSDVTVTVNYGPGNSISFQPNKDVLERVENQTVSDIVCFADCEPPCTYIWSNAGTTYPNPLSLSTAVRGNAGQYTCSASNSVGQGTKTWNLIVRCKYCSNVGRAFKLHVHG
ncbi:carcinoembryonic antigen-related cell adhesion molecule 5-like [Mizuhopecten yessoensis]|uniref:carcinoembryonic antigen-related cell adhesion molecule 5-like n=1 Tax=Mizuhopecten yessoensis TaxID=6573 RepID=UPI000B45D9AC|nr:carcinoembryonic antigen-related cell adhesion molecule 5-like [Mizuhopecten yessoensis]